MIKDRFGDVPKMSIELHPRGQQYNQQHQHRGPAHVQRREEGPSLDARVVRQYWLHFQEMERLREEQSTC